MEGNGMTTPTPNTSGESEMLEAVYTHIPHGARVIEGGAGPEGSPVTALLRTRTQYLASFDPFIPTDTGPGWSTRRGVVAVHSGTRTLAVGERWNRSTIRPGGIDSVRTIEYREVRAYALAYETTRYQADALVLDVEGSEMELLMAPLPRPIRSGVVEIHHFALGPWWESIHWGLKQQGFTLHLASYDANADLSVVAFTR
jgi:hypothetical protein